MPRLPFQNSIVDYVSWGVWMSGIITLLFFSTQSDFVVVGTSYAVAFCAYFWMIKHPYDRRGLGVLIGLGILARLIAVFAFPSLSDDIYRFIWDGRLAIEGYHPFEHLPSYYLDLEPAVPGIDQALYDELNSQEYYTIYPTICQWVFAFCASLAPDSITGFSIALKGFLALLDIASIGLLYRILLLMDLDTAKVKWYALNPLVIIEISGNAHFEGAMIFFILLAIYLLLKKKERLSALALSAAIASKMIPLIFMPLLFAVLPWKKALRYCCLVGLGLLVFAIPLMSSWEHLSQSIALYFQKFEFNASVYYIVRWVGFQIKGWNIIADAGPVLGMIVFISIWILTFFNRKNDIYALPRLMLWSLVFYLFLATIVHPWYLTTLVALSALCRMRFVLLWSGLITLTYINYSYDPFFENLWVVGFEYLLVVIMLIYEIKKDNFRTPVEPLFKVKPTN